MKLLLTDDNGRTITSWDLEDIEAIGDLSKAWTQQTLGAEIVREIDRCYLAQEEAAGG